MTAHAIHSPLCMLPALPNPELTSSAPHCSEEKGPNVQTASTATKYNVTQPEWREKFHLCVFESNQVLKLVIAHNMEYSASLSCLGLCAAWCLPKSPPVAGLASVECMTQSIDITTFQNDVD